MDTSDTEDIRIHSKAPAEEDTEWPQGRAGRGELKTGAFGPSKARPARKPANAGRGTCDTRNRPKQGSFDVAVR